MRRHPRLTSEQQETLGESLLAKIADGTAGRLSLDEFAPWFAQLTQAIAVAKDKDQNAASTSVEAAERVEAAKQEAKER